MKAKMDKDKKAEALKLYEDNLDESYKDYNPVIEERLIASLVEVFFKDIPESYQPAYFKTINKKYKGDFKTFAKELFKTSVFATEDSFRKFS